LGIDLKVTTVTETELSNSGIGISSTIGRTPESFVLGESRLDVGALASDDDRDTFEDTLNTISNGSFPPQGERENLSAGQKRQLRDAMVFTTHVRERRDIFVTDDARGFINDGRREYLEGRYNTKIMRSEELFDFLLRLSHEDA
jgi:hypothetical protein